MTRPKILCVGEAMVEMAPLGHGQYRRGFAGDTFNTAWHMAQVLGPRADVGFVTRVGQDSISTVFVEELAADGLSTETVARSEDRTMGLYMIALDGVERSFHYWRSASAARQLADDPARLDRDLSGADLIHLSGITVAILPPTARATLLASLVAARAKGCRISFDPNVRPALWSSLEEVRQILPDFLATADILLPSFDDEHRVWGDSGPEATLDRLEAFGTGEVVIKDGAGPVHLSIEGERFILPTPPVDDIRDTTGAGDAFNAGYLAARALGHAPGAAVRSGQDLAALVLQCPGARADKDLLGDRLLEP
ncbi:MAG: sugar kinase [Pseudomonadota bacterium]